jgi:translation initiation factor 3 subunit A
LHKMAPFTKPENVLKQAEGLVAVGQTHAALQSLLEMFNSKRFRSTPLTSLEPIMIRFIELCVEMRKGRAAKEGLMNYKNIAQNTSVASIETVITKFVQLADTKVTEAQAKAAVQIAVDVDDLEASETPESILLGAVSGDQTRDRTDRALVTPWLKFLWESYRTSLETLKNNARLEAIYQQIAQQAFRFCLKHERKVEFRRLCETLRLHLANVAKYSHQTHSINLSDPETLQHHLDTRFAQLNTSVELELWQEAFRSVEDVHNLLTLAKKAPKPAMMANYYEKLTKIFLMSGNALYHAAAWNRYYSVAVTMGSSWKSEEEMVKLAGQVLVSALAVPVGTGGSEQKGETKGKNAKLSALLGLSKTPTRAGLLRDALSRDVLKLSPPTIQSLYEVLQVTFDPLALCSSIAPILSSLSSPDDPYAAYLPLLQRALLSRLLSQLSEVYSTITITSLLELIEPLHSLGWMDEAQVEAFIMGCARRGELNVKVDHAQGRIVFVDETFVGKDADEDQQLAHQDLETCVQMSMEERVRTRLSRLAQSLHTSLQTIAGPSQPRDTEEEQRQKFENLVAAAEAERKSLLIKRAIVAKRRELLSELSAKKEKEDVTRRAEINRREKEEESRRLREEMRKKELERARREVEGIRVEEARKLAATLVEKGLKGVNIDDMDQVSTDKLMELQVAQLEKEKKDMTQRLRVIAKRIDHIERAYRKEERPLLAEDYEKQQSADQESFQSIQQARRDAHLLAHQRDLETKKRLVRMLPDYNGRREEIIRQKGEHFAKRKDAANKKIEEEKAKRREYIMKQREEERKAREEEERKRLEEEAEEARLEAERLAEEERRLAEEEEARAVEEAAKRQKEEEAQAMRKARDAERAAAAEQARLQRQREEEAEARRELRKQQEKDAAAAARRPGLTPPSRVAATTNGDPWRRSGTPSNATPATPTRSSLTTPPARTESPNPAAAAGPAKYKPGAFAAGGGGGGWRARDEATKEAAAGSPATRASPLPPSGATREQPKAEEEDGFQTVQKPNVWKPRRGRG